MKRFARLLTFIFVSVVNVSISYSQDASTHADLKMAARAWRNFKSCARNLENQDAAYARCLKAAMGPGADRFELMKATEFLALDAPVKTIGRCPAMLLPTQKLRPATSRFACFTIESTNAVMGGEIEFNRNKNGELFVRRVRYSF